MFHVEPHNDLNFFVPSREERHVYLKGVGIR
jgi:hypothetical protein